MKWIGRIVILFVFVVAVISVFAYFNLKATQPPDAEYAVQAFYEDKNGLEIPTRIYYAKEIRIIDGDAVLYDYWDYNGERYHAHSGNKTVSQPYKIIKRGAE